MGFSSAWVKICQISHVNFELTSQFFFKFCIIPHCHDTILPSKFWAHKFSTLDKRIPLKSQFLDFQTYSGENLLNSWCHFWKHKSVYLQIFHQIQCHQAKLPYTFLAQKLYTLFRRSPLKRKFFWDFQVLGSKFVKFLMSVLKRQVSFSSNFALFIIVMAHNSPASLKLIHF